MKRIANKYHKWKNKKLKELWVSSKYPEVNLVIATALKEATSFEAYLRKNENS